ncbi:Tetrahydrofolate dehydrogenase/cyclohydrolase [Planctomycetes bacterium Pan216]|uniref:Bifunctional protein FolD n=1 Tax=Kolteria novifilia TaxID=2527975 RepID=A0A518AYK1_9BACT|nr:Tetrahydrofolate dehydrogenase/cyclohydrolase [Planctomycetes bacterium Pan216]
MSASIIDGKRIAKELREEIAGRVASFRGEHSIQPKLVAILVGEDPASQVYIRNKQRACEQAGLASSLIRLPDSVSQSELLGQIEDLNQAPDVHGILVQLPLPEGISADLVLRAIRPEKDVDCFHPENVGMLAIGTPRFLPCTPAGVVELLKRSGVETRGAHVVICGRSNIVGKPLALMMMQKGDGGDATVSVCHSRSRNLEELTRQADILVAAVGREGFITGSMIRPGATVIDVGTNRSANGKLVGDVVFEEAVEIAGAITPVPGGVGPMTVTLLLENTLRGARRTVR